MIDNSENAVILRIICVIVFFPGDWSIDLLNSFVMATWIMYIDDMLSFSRINADIWPVRLCTHSYFPLLKLEPVLLKVRACKMPD